MNQKNKSHKITLPTLVAYNATPQAQKLIVSHGYPRASNVKELEFRLAQVLKEHGEDGLGEIAKIHPHRDLILSSHTKMEGGQRNDGYYYGATGFPPDPTYVFRGQGVEPTLMEVEDWGDVRYRRHHDNYSADGAAVTKILGAGGIILCVIGFGALLIAFGERGRSYQH